MEKNDLYSIQSIKRAVSLLRCFSTDEPELNLIQLSNKLGLHKSTVQRIVKTLEAEKILRKNDNRKTYCLGVMILQLGKIVLETADIRNLSLPFMRDLSVGLGYMVFLSQVSDGQKICIEKVGTRHGMQPSIQVGHVVSLHIGGSGKVLLAFMDEAQVDQILDAELGPPSEETAAQKESLKRQLLEIRRKGYATGYEERVVGGAGISAPIFDHNDNVTASLSLVGLVEDIRRNETHLIPEIMDTARKISSLLGAGESMFPG